MIGALPGAAALLFLLAGACAGGAVAVLFLARGQKSAALGVGLAVALMLGPFGAVLGFACLKRAETEARRGWNLKPVVVAAIDIPAGVPITFDMISQRSVPEQFVDAAMITPDAANEVVNQRSAAALQAGEPLVWGLVCTPRPR